MQWLEPIIYYRPIGRTMATSPATKKYHILSHIVITVRVITTHWVEPTGWGPQDS